MFHSKRLKIFLFILLGLKILILVQMVLGDELRDFEEASRSKCDVNNTFPDNIIPAAVPKFTKIVGISNDVTITFTDTKKFCNLLEPPPYCASTEIEVGSNVCDCVKCVDDESLAERVIRMANNVMKYLTAISIHLSRVNGPEKQLQINIMSGPQPFQECSNSLGTNTKDKNEEELYNFIVDSINWGVHPNLYRRVLQNAENQGYSLVHKFCLSNPETIPHLKCLVLDNINKTILPSISSHPHSQYCYFWNPYYQLLSSSGKLDLLKPDEIIGTDDIFDSSFLFGNETNKIYTNSPYVYVYYNFGQDFKIYGELGSVCSDNNQLNVPCVETSLYADWHRVECKMGVCGGPESFYQQLYANTKVTFTPTTLTEVTGKTDPSEGLGGVINKLLTSSERITPNSDCSIKMWEYGEGKYIENSGLRRTRDYGSDELIYTFENIKRKFRWRWGSFLNNLILFNGTVDIDLTPRIYTCLKRGFQVKNVRDCREFSGTIGCLSEMPSMTCTKVNQDDKCICRDDPLPFSYKEVNGKCIASKGSICTTANGQIPCEEGTECKIAIPVEDELPNVLTPFTIKVCKKIPKEDKKSKQRDNKSSIQFKISIEFIMLNFLLTIYICVWN